MPKLAILTACYNDAQYLPESVASALAQTEPDIEVCIVDNGSTDNTRKVATDLWLSDSRVRLKSFAKNRPHGAAMNLAMRETTAPWALVHNADDIMEPGYVAEILRVAAEDPTVNCVFSPLQWFGHRTDVQVFPPYNPAKMVEQHQIPGHRAFTRELWDRLGGEDESIAIGSDWDWAVRASRVGLKPVQLARPYVRIRDHGPNVKRLGGSADMPALRAHMRRHAC